MAVLTVAAPPALSPGAVEPNSSISQSLIESDTLFFDCPIHCVCASPEAFASSLRIESR
jgi:hypothetical protein